MRNQALLILLVLLGCTGCAGGGISTSQIPSSAASSQLSNDYRIGPGDQLSIFVWQNPDLSVIVPVRPDGKISTPLVEDMVAAGKTPTELGLDIEVVLAEFIRAPEVTVIVQSFVGTFDGRIRVVGQAAQPRAIPYAEGMTVLDVMIEVGGLTEFASGNRASVIRGSGASALEIRVRLDDLLNEGDISQNIAMRPGDIVLIPGSFF